MESNDISLRVGPHFYDFDVKSIEITGRFKKTLNPEAKLDHVFVHIRKGGEYLGVATFCKPDDPLMSVFGSKKIASDNTFVFKYDFKSPGLYSFEIKGYDEKDNEYGSECFSLRCKF